MKINKTFNQPEAITYVVNNDMCTGCGICVSSCPTNSLGITLNKNGFLIPEQISDCDSNGSCLNVCPFNPLPKKEVKTENEIAKLFLNEVKFDHPKIGKYQGIYAGYSNEFRLTSSSGGIASYILSQLLERGVVSHVFSVKESKEKGMHYEYGISNNRKEILSSSKTRYFPVTLATVMSEINKLEGKVAIVGVACFIKAIRLAQFSNPILKEKTPFLVGIICGGVKSSFFTEYLASKAQFKKSEYSKPDFRIKDFERTAGDYSFGCYDDKGKQKTFKMSEVGDMWGTGLFKCNACDFCDDVTTELADVSLGDAWLDPYVKDGKGHNVVVTRSLLADKIIQEGLKKKELVVENLTLNKFLASQKGSFNHRHDGLAYRIKKQGKKNIEIIPPKRFDNIKISIFFKMVQFARMKVRKKSLEVWKKKSDFRTFQKKMRMSLYILRKLTNLNHKMRTVFKK